MFLCCSVFVGQVVGMTEDLEELVGAFDCFGGLIEVFVG